MEPQGRATHVRRVRLDVHVRVVRRRRFVAQHARRGPICRRTAQHAQHVRVSFTARVEHFTNQHQTKVNHHALRQRLTHVLQHHLIRRHFIHLLMRQLLIQEQHRLVQQIPLWRLGLTFRVGQLELQQLPDVRPCTLMMQPVERFRPKMYNIIQRPKNTITLPTLLCIIRRRPPVIIYTLDYMIIIVVRHLIRPKVVCCTARRLSVRRDITVRAAVSRHAIPARMRSDGALPFVRWGIIVRRGHPKQHSARAEDIERQPAERLLIVVPSVQSGHIVRRVQPGVHHVVPVPPQLRQVRQAARHSVRHVPTKQGSVRGRPRGHGLQTLWRISAR